jgi:hypothetical protein
MISKGRLQILYLILVMQWYNFTEVPFYISNIYFKRNQRRWVKCKTNTLLILMHQMCISTTQVSSVMLRSKKLEIRGKKWCENWKSRRMKTKQSAMKLSQILWRIELQDNIYLLIYKWFALVIMPNRLIFKFLRSVSPECLKFHRQCTWWLTTCNIFRIWTSDSLNLEISYYPTRHLSRSKM